MNHEEAIGKVAVLIIVGGVSVWVMVRVVIPAIEKMDEMIANAINWAWVGATQQLKKGWMKLIVIPVVCVILVFELLVNLDRPVRGDEAFELALLAGALLFVMVSVTEWFKR